jgi:hypothetical protein
MLADFLDAHDRHWGDAERLFAAGRFANADHLYGMATECGLKRLMMRFGMQVDPMTGGPADRQDWKHVNNIWARFESYRSGKVESVAYGLPMPNPFANWDVSDRYAHQSNFDLARVEGHQASAQTVRNLIARAQREGLL